MWLVLGEAGGKALIALKAAILIAVLRARRRNPVAFGH